MAGQLDDLEAQLKLKRICRFCMRMDGPLSNIYSSQNRLKSRAPLPLQIMSCVSIEAFTNDGMPSMICDPCRLIMDFNYRFKQMCKQADTSLKQFPLTGLWPSKLEIPIFPHELLQYQKMATKRSGEPMEIISISPNKKTMSIQKLAKFSSVTIQSTDQFRSKKLKTEPKQHQQQQSHLIQLPIITNQNQIKQSSPQIIVPPLQKQNVQSSGGGGGGGSDSSPTSQKNTQQQQNPPRILNKSLKILNKDAPRSLSPTMSEPVAVQNERGQIEISAAIKEQPLTVPTNVFPCNNCDRSFPLRQLLTIHLERHKRERSFECDVCTKRFFSKYDLGKHTLTHTEEKPFVCVVCNKGFSRSTLLQRHEKVHTNEPKFNCTVCNRQFLSKLDMDKHMINHGKNRPFACKLCDKTFAYKQGLERHETVHDTDHPNKCEHCSESFSTPSKLARHLSKHAGPRPYPCRLCHRSYLLSHHLTRHVRSHSQVGYADYSCNECHKKFTSRADLIYHSAIHASESLSCPLCKEQYHTLADVKDHIKTHTTGEQFACEFCDLIFTTEFKLDNHISLEHIEEQEIYLNDDQIRVGDKSIESLEKSPRPLQLQTQPQPHQSAEDNEVIEEFYIDEYTVDDEQQQQQQHPQVNSVNIDIEKTEQYEENDQVYLIPYDDNSDPDYEQSIVKLVNSNNKIKKTKSAVRTTPIVKSVRSSDVVDQTLLPLTKLPSKLEIASITNRPTPVKTSPTTSISLRSSNSSIQTKSSASKSPVIVSPKEITVKSSIKNHQQYKFNNTKTITTRAEGGAQKKTIKQSGSTPTTGSRSGGGGDSIGGRNASDGASGSNTGEQSNKEMVFGEQMIRVQKIKMTKAEVARMAKEGKIEIKDGQVFLKK